MRLSYSVSDLCQNELDSMPRLTMVLSRNSKEVEVVGLLDSGAMVNVMPYEMGIHLAHQKGFGQHQPRQHAETDGEEREEFGAVEGWSEAEHGLSYAG